jgi:hypothetical protein
MVSLRRLPVLAAFGPCGTVAQWAGARAPGPLLDGALILLLEPRTLVAELAVEALRDASLPALAGLDQRRTDALAGDPGPLRYELRAVVTAQERRRTTLAQEARQHLDRAQGPNAAVDVDRQPFLRELVRHGQAFLARRYCIGLELTIS